MPAKPLTIAANTVVSFEYTLKDEQGNLIDQSAGQGPMTYVHGQQEIVAGLERALSGRRAGDSFKVAVQPAEGYGPRDPGLAFEVPRHEFPASIKPEPGMQLAMGGADGRQELVSVMKVSDGVVVLDRNHPLAGKTLHFDIQVSEVRKAEPSDLEGSCCGSGGGCCD